MISEPLVKTPEISVTEPIVVKGVRDLTEICLVVEALAGKQRTNEAKNRRRSFFTRVPASGRARLS
jgi:hypothetical protein